MGSFSRPLIVLRRLGGLTIEAMRRVRARTLVALRRVRAQFPLALRRLDWRASVPWLAVVSTGALFAFSGQARHWLRLRSFVEDLLLVTVMLSFAAAWRCVNLMDHCSRGVRSRVCPRADYPFVSRGAVPGWSRRRAQWMRLQRESRRRYRQHIAGIARHASLRDANPGVGIDSDRESATA